MAGAVLCGQVQDFVDVEVQFSWQVQDFVDVEVQFSWQVQDFVDVEVRISWQVQGLCGPWSADFVAGP